MTLGYKKLSKQSFNSGGDVIENIITLGRGVDTNETE